MIHKSNLIETDKLRKNLADLTDEFAGQTEKMNAMIQQLDENELKLATIVNTNNQINQVSQK